MAGENKTAIVTGGTHGIGNGIAKELARQGMNVVITSRSEEKANTASNEIYCENSCVTGVAFDLENSDSINTLIDTTIERFGRIDVLVNNALSQKCVLPVNNMTNKEIESIFTTNITNTFLLCREAYPYLKASQGNIINIASVIVNRYVIGMPLYRIIKGAIIHATQALAAEWAQDKIRVNAINPGFVYSNSLAVFNLSKEEMEERYENNKRFHPLGMIGKPDDIAALAGFLSSPEASFITGSIYDCDAGFSVQGISMKKSTETQVVEPDPLSS